MLWTTDKWKYWMSTICPLLKPSRVTQVTCFVCQSQRTHLQCLTSFLMLIWRYWDVFGFCCYNFVCNTFKDAALLVCHVYESLSDYVANCSTGASMVMMWILVMMLIEKKGFAASRNMRLFSCCLLKGCPEVVKANWNIIPQRHVFILIVLLCVLLWVLVFF